MASMDQTAFHLHLVSDATGETINSITRACLVQFDKVKVQEHQWSLIRTRRQLAIVLDGLKEWPGLVLYTFVDEELDLALSSFCRENAIPCLSVLDPVLDEMTAYFGKPSAHKPGRQHALTADYFDRIDAMDFALSQDDGNQADKAAEADVLVLGVSRTSKTPTCVYLAHRGIRAANIPIVPGLPLPVDFKKLTKPLIVGLTKDPDQLVETRLSRLRFLNQNEKSPYIDPVSVREEVAEAKKLFLKLECPVIDVSRRSIEETAAEIMMLYQKRMMQKKEDDKRGQI